MPATATIRRGTGALAALAAVGALAVPARAETLSDAYPSPQAIAANAEFLAQVPPPAGGAGTVCVIDTGVTPLPDTASQIIERIAIDGGTPDDIDHIPGDPRSGHGSFVASVIASQIDGRGSAGIWPAAKIISVRVFSPGGDGATAAQYNRAITECTQAGRAVRIVNISLGSSGMGEYQLANLEDRINDAHRNWNINVVASAGNEGHHAAILYPARFPASFAVGGTDGSGAFCSFSNRGAGLDISAFGCDLHATDFDGARAGFAGTSYAAPTVAAILVALRAYRPDLTAGQAESLVVETARNTSAGRVIDAEAAFGRAGLTHLVDAYESPLNHAGKPNSIRITQDARPAKPRLLSASFKRRVMRVRVAKPRRRGWDAIFRVNGKSYVRPSGALTLRARAWRPVSVLIEDQWGVRSNPLEIDRPVRR